MITGNAILLLSLGAFQLVFLSVSFQDLSNQFRSAYLLEILIAWHFGVELAQSQIFPTFFAGLVLVETVSVRVHDSPVTCAVLGIESPAS